MTINEAIKILTLDVKGNTSISYEDWQKALKLGSEALKRFQEVSAWPHEYLKGPLPGETEEEKESV